MSTFGGLGIAASGLNAARAALGFGPLKDPLGEDGMSSRLSLFAVSPVAFRRPKRWPAHLPTTVPCNRPRPAASPPSTAPGGSTSPPPVVSRAGIAQDHDVTLGN